MNSKETIFFTGFPGFIAERLIERLAAQDVRFYFLVQPHLVETALEYLHSLSKDKAIPLENFSVVKGDICLANAGIAPKDLDILRNEVTSVFHLAAIYDLAVEQDIAVKINLEGTKNINDLVRSMPHLKRYNYISTCYVAGKRSGRILENELSHEAGFRNHYEETKYLAEIEVEKLKADLPVTIFRPSVVVGDSIHGKTVKYDGIYSLIRYLMITPSLLRFVNIGNRNVKLNLVPVDYVAESIATLAFDDKAIGKTIAIADPAPLTTSELFDLFAKCLVNNGSVIHPPVDLVERVLTLEIAQKITGIPSSGVPYFFIEQEYDTSEAKELLARHGIICPELSTYAQKLVEFVQKHPKL